MKQTTTLLSIFVLLFQCLACTSVRDIPNSHEQLGDKIVASNYAAMQAISSRWQNNTFTDADYPLMQQHLKAIVNQFSSKQKCRSADAALVQYVPKNADEQAAKNTVLAVGTCAYLTQTAQVFASVLSRPVAHWSARDCRDYELASAVDLAVGATLAFFPPTNPMGDVFLLCGAGFHLIAMFKGC